MAEHGVHTSCYSSASKLTSKALLFVKKSLEQPAIHRTPSKRTSSRPNTTLDKTVTPDSESDVLGSPGTMRGGKAQPLSSSHSSAISILCTIHLRILHAINLRHTPLPKSAASNPPYSEPQAKGPNTTHAAVAMTSSAGSPVAASRV